MIEVIIGGLSFRNFLCLLLDYLPPYREDYLSEGGVEGKVDRILSHCERI